MKFELDKNDLICLVGSVSPSKEFRQKPEISALKDCRNPETDWEWNYYKLLNMTELELFGLYKMITNNT